MQIIVLELKGAQKVANNLRVESHSINIGNDIQVFRTISNFIESQKSVEIGDIDNSSFRTRLHFS